MREKQKVNATKVRNRAYLAEAIYNLIEGYGFINGRPKTGKAVKVVNAILASIVASLRRGEEVKVLGFGKFKIVSTKPVKKSVRYISGGRKQDQAKAFQTTAPTLIQLNSKKKVIFVPTKHLIRSLNE